MIAEGADILEIGAESTRPYGGAVRVSVHDDGAGPSGRASSTAHGIVGMRERVAAYGGTLRTGARPGGGFEVEASIPLPEQEAP